MEKKKENLKAALLKRLSSHDLPYWLVVILFTIPFLAVVFAIVALTYLITDVMPSARSFYTEFALCAAAFLVFLIFTIRCFLRRKRSAAVMLGAAAAVFLFFSARFALDLPYVNNPCTTTLHNITMDMEIDYSPDSPVHYYMLYGYDGEGKKQSLEIDENDYYDYKSRADTAVISYLPHSHKVMNIDFF